MSARTPVTETRDGFLARHPVASYFFLAYAISWLGAFLLVAPKLIHISSTGALVIFSPAQVTAAAETEWYWVYAIALWLPVGMIVLKYGKRLTTART